MAASGRWLSSAVNSLVLSETPLLVSEISLPGAANLLSAAGGMLRIAAGWLAGQEGVK